MNRIILSLALIATIATSCKESKKQVLLPHITGAMHDVVLIMSPNNWEGEPGEVIRTVLGQPVEYLPQAEELFNIIWMPHDAFTRVIKKQRNIIVTKIGPDYQPKITYSKSLWAQSQLIIQIMAPNPEAFKKLFEEYGTNICDYIQDTELERLKNSYEKSQETKIHKDLLEKHQIDLIIPRGFSVNKEGEDFIWLDNRHRNIIEGILIYYYPYVDSNSFTREYQIAKRNSIFKQHVSGEMEGSYPSTENRFPVLSNEYNLNGKRYTFELRGLWHVLDGYAMGGPFISISQFDKERNRIVTVDGFLFAPGEDKRNLIKRLEAILYTLDFREID